MEVKIKTNNGMLDATIEMVDGVMVVSPIEKFVPKDGDVCASLSCLYIFKTTRPSNNKKEQAVVYYCCYHINDDTLFPTEDVGVGYISRNNRYATEEEKKLLFDKIDQEGLAWDADKKELVKKKWKPMAGQRFYIPAICNAQFKAVTDDWSDDDRDILYFDKGWIFRTEEECQQFCDKLNQAINSIKP